MPSVVSTYTSISEAYGTTVSVAAGETLYMLCPTGWMEGKSVEIEDGNGNTFSLLEDYDAVTISGYVIYKTQVWNDAAKITLKTTGAKKPAYIGAGANVNEVAINANMTMNYGGGSVEYSGVVSNDGDNIYILLPEGTPYIGVFAGGQPSAIEDGGTTTIAGVTYVVRYIDSVYAGAYSITVKYTNVLAPAYIGAGTSVNAVAVDANKITNYGSGSVTYNVPVISGDNIYIIMPIDVTYSAFMGGQPMYLGEDSNIIIGGITYTVKHSISFETTSTKTITLNYN